METGVDFEVLKSRLAGCYVTVPTPFEDSAGFPVNHHAIRSYVRFLLDHGLSTDYATLLSGGAAGDFSTMSFEERLSVAETIADETQGKSGLAHFRWRNPSVKALGEARIGVVESERHGRGIATA